MWKNYLKIAWRNLTRHKFFSVINICCLAIGITFSLVIGVYVFNEYNVNRSLRNVDDQYIIKSDWKVKDMGLDITTFGPLAKTLREEFPALVANYFRYNPVTNVVSAGDKHFKEDIAICDTTLVSMYGFELLEGNPNQAFANNNSAVITEAMATKLFGKAGALNKLISINTVSDTPQVYTVSAVLKDIPYNSVTNLIGNGCSVYVPTVGNRYYPGGDPSVFWNSAYEVGMIQLQPGVFSAQLNDPIKQVLKKFTTETVQENLAVYLAPVKDYYLKDHEGSVLKMLTNLSVAAIFILLMAVINFVNLNIGSSAYRLKEIGLRRTFGGKRQQLIVQFIAEAIVLTFFAALLSLFLYQLLRPIFNSTLNTVLPSIFQFGPELLFGVGLLLVFTGFAAGMYPAFVLSGYNPVKAVKGVVTYHRGGSMFRKAMLVTQFTLGIVVLISAFTISQQVNYIFSKDVGYNKEQVMVITAFPKQWDSAGVNRMMNVRSALMDLPDVVSASLSFEIPDRKPPNSLDMKPLSGAGQKVFIPSFGADDQFAKTFGLRVLKGNFFSQQVTNIPNQVVLSESAVKALGLKAESVVNTQIALPSSPATTLTVAGVVNDYHYSSLQNRIEPVAFFNVRDNLSYRYLSVKIKSANIAESITQIRDTWKDMLPAAPFDFTFMDDKFQSLYKTEIQLKQASQTATVLAIIIVLLGVVGLVSLNIQKRRKEIGIRKVLGSSVPGVVFLFIHEFISLLVLGSAIACPLAWVFVKGWLDEYAYRIDLTALPFICSVAAFGIIAIAVIGMQTFRAASINPVESLRTE